METKKRPRRILITTSPSGVVELWSNIRVFAENYNLNQGTIRTYLASSAKRFRNKKGSLQYNREAVTVFGFNILEKFLNTPSFVAECTDSEDSINCRKTKNKLTKEK